MKNKKAKVRQWLQAIPANDNPRRDSDDEQVYESWEQWIQAGKSIKKVEEELLFLLESDEDKVTILTAIGQLGSAKSYEHLIPFCENENPVLRVGAVEALGLLQLTKATNLLCAMRDDVDENVRANVYQALHKMNNEEASACIAKGKTDESEWVRKVVNTILKDKE